VYGYCPFTMEIKANSKKNEGQKKGKSEGGKWQT
jgi:hypothetical protein